MKKTAIGVSMIAGALLSIAVSERTASADPADKDGHYTYVFKDDALEAEGRDALIAQIRVRQRGVREQLLRPRVHFVGEMLKSVEGL